MGWKGTMRSLGAAARRMERQHLQELKAVARGQELAHAYQVVAEYEAHMTTLVTLHHGCSPRQAWEDLAHCGAPLAPAKAEDRSRAAQQALEAYTPSLLDRILGRGETRRAELSAAVDLAREAEEKHFGGQLEAYRAEVARWQRVGDLSCRILEGNPDAYVQAITELNPLENIPVGRGASIGFADARRGDARLQLFPATVVPGEVRSLLQSGRLKVSKMPAARGHEIYRDHVCSAVLRLGWELFSFLPLEEVLVHGVSEVLNPGTGHIEEQALLSVRLPRATLERLNPRKVEPARALDNFVHRMAFRKNNGLAPVEPLTWEEFTT